MKLDKLQVMYCFPHDKQNPSDRLIKVRVSDGDNTVYMKFGRHTSMKTVISQIPIIFGVNTSKKSRKRVAV